MLKLRALRTGAWFKVLNQLDRALINLTIRVADKVRSSRLAEALARVTDKVRNALEDKFVKAIVKYGFPLARRFGLLAASWGNPYAESWVSDLSYAKFLALLHFNGSFKNMQ